MIHRHITTTSWTQMAIASLFERGSMHDWKEFAESLKSDPEVSLTTRSVINWHDDVRSIALAEYLLSRFKHSVSDSQK